MRLRDCSPEEIQSSCPTALVSLWLYRISVSMGADMHNLEVTLDNIWENVTKLAQVIYSVFYIDYYPI